MEIDLLGGVRTVGNVVNLAVAGIANAVAMFQQSNAANQVGTRSFKAKRLKVRNNGGGNCYLHMGTGAAGAVVDRVPPLYIVNVVNSDWVEYDLPEYEYFGDMMAYPDVLPGGGSLDVQVEVEEIG